MGLEVALADRGVELLALSAGGIGVVEVAGVLHGNGVAFLGLGDAVAGRDDSLSNTHDDRCGVEWLAGEESGSVELEMRVNGTKKGSGHSFQVRSRSCGAPSVSA